MAHFEVDLVLQLGVHNCCGNQAEHIDEICCNAFAVGLKGKIPPPGGQPASQAWATCFIPLHNIRGDPVGKNLHTKTLAHSREK